MSGRILQSLVAAAVFTALSAVPSTAQTRVGLHSSSGSCANCDLSGKDLPGMILRDANFSGSIFNRSNLSGGKIYNSDLSGTHFRKAFLARVKGRNVNLAKSEMQDVTLTEAEFGKSIFVRANMRRADLARASFKDSEFNHADLSSASAPGADFTGTKFIGANFDHANLQEATLDGAILKNVKFGNAILRGATFKGANLSGADLSDSLGLTQVQLDAACGNPSTDLPLGLSVSYCSEAMTTDNAYGHKHSGKNKRNEYAAKRLDRAVENLESLMSDIPAGDRNMQRNLQKIHADLVSARREIEK